MLGDFGDKLLEPGGGPEGGRRRAIGVISTAGDRRDDDMRELGAVAADHFDALVVREDANLRGRAAGETASVVAEGVRARMAEGARCRDVELELDEVAA